MTKNKMGTEPIFKLLMTMALPAMLSMLIQSMYNVVDSMFVAQIGTDAMTAVSLAFPIQNIIVSLGVGIGVGINSVISRKLGEKEYDKANTTASYGIIIGIIASILFIIFGLTCTEAFFRIFTDSKKVIELGTSYTYIVTMFSFGVIIHIIIEKIIQSTGNMIYPMIAQAAGAIINIILDPIFIFGMFGLPKMGVTGAAIATVSGQVVSMLLSIYILIFKSYDVKIKRTKFIDWKIVKDIFAVGIPTMLMMSLGSILVMGINAILISISEISVAIFGIYFKLQSFIFMPVSGLTQGAMPILGYNYGAKNYSRFSQTLKYGIYVALGIMLVGFSIFVFMPKQLLILFNASKDMLEIGVVALRLISISFIPAAFSLLYATAFQSIGKGNLSLLITLLRQLIIVLPLSFILSKIIGLEGVWITFPIAEVVAAIFAWIAYKKVSKNDEIFTSIV